MSRAFAIWISKDVGSMGRNSVLKTPPKKAELLIPAIKTAIIEIKALVRECFCFGVFEDSARDCWLAPLASGNAVPQFGQNFEPTETFWEHLLHFSETILLVIEILV